MNILIFWLHLCNTHWIWYHQLLVFEEMRKKFQKNTKNCLSFSSNNNNNNIKRSWHTLHTNMPLTMMVFFFRSVYLNVSWNSTWTSYARAPINYIDIVSWELPPPNNNNDLPCHSLALAKINQSLKLRFLCESLVVKSFSITLFSWFFFHSLLHFTFINTFILPLEMTNWLISAVFELSKVKKKSTE